MTKISSALRVVAALVVVLVCRVLGIPVGVSGQKAMDAAIRRAGRPLTARPARYEGQVNLRQARAWYAISKVSDLNSLFNSIFEDAMFVARDTGLMVGLVTTYAAQGMAARKISVYPSFTAQETSEGVDYSNAQTLDKTLVATLTPKIVKAQAILTDERMMTDPQGARTDAAVEMGGAVATKIDLDLVSEFPNLTTDKGTAGSALTIRRCAAGLAVLRKNNVRGPFSVVLHPYGWHDVWVELGQPTANQAFLGDTANQAMRDYGVGSFLSAAWYTDANIPNVSGTVDVVSAVFSRQAFAIDVRTAPEMEPERDASLSAWELNIRARYATGTRRPTYGVKLTHDATEPT